jgi:murein DD-endopeptidase MepM/ murein hydrolase activator NlpD
VFNAAWRAVQGPATRVRRWLLLLVFAAVLVLPAPAAAQSGGPGQPMVHIVQRGETLFSIARRYGTTVDAITHANSIADPRQIFVGQRILISGSMGPSDSWSVHVVRPGETLEVVAGQYGLPWRTVALVNRVLNPHLLSAGQVLRLPVGEDGPRSGALHTVQPGETLAGISFHYGVGLWELATANAIANPALVLRGQRLLIPGERPAWMPAPFEAVEMEPLPVRQGQTVRVRVRTSEPVFLEGALFEHPLQFSAEDGIYSALAGVHAFAEPGLYELELVATNAAGEQATASAGVVVDEGGYGYERIDVPPSRTQLLDAELVAAEQARLEEVQNLFTPARRWQGSFLRPVEAAVSSYYGTRRSYEGGPYNSYHAGVDFNAGQGTPVHAPAAGTVVLAEPLTVRGNAVVLDHGWGVLTGYWHLSTIEAAAGQEVQVGDVIGKVGSTGLSTGSHLHWEFWVGGVSVDGLQWLSPAYPWPDLGAVSVP